MFWIMVTLCIGRVVLLKKIIAVLGMKQAVHVSVSYDGS